MLKPHNDAYEVVQLTDLETPQILDLKEQPKESDRTPIKVTIDFPLESNESLSRIESSVDLQHERDAGVYLFEEGQRFNTTKHHEPMTVLDIEEDKERKIEWMSVRQPYSTTRSTHRQKYVFFNPIPGEIGPFDEIINDERTNNIEVTAGMPPNSVRVFIWNGFYQNTTINKLFGYLGFATQSNGHIAMCIKDEKEKVTHISLYYDEKAVEQRNGYSPLKINFGKKARFLEYFNRDKNEIKDKGCDYGTQAGKRFSLYRYTAGLDDEKIKKGNFKNAVILTPKGAYIVYDGKPGDSLIAIDKDSLEMFNEEKDRKRDRVARFENMDKHYNASNIITEVLKKMGDNRISGLHADYVIEIIGFTPLEINQMIDLYQEKKDIIRWRKFGDFGCFDAFCSMSKYQNCSSVVYNILKAGNFTEKLPGNLRSNYSIVRKIGSIVGKELARFVFWFLIFWGVSELINRYVLKDPYTADQGIIFSVLLSIGRSALATILVLCWKCCNLCVIGEKEESLSPMNFKKALLNAATSSDPTGNIRLVHTSETLRDVLVVAAQKKMKPTAEPVARYKEMAEEKISKFYLEYVSNDNIWLFNLLSKTRYEVRSILDKLFKEAQYPSESSAKNKFCADFCHSLFGSQENYLRTQNLNDNPFFSLQKSGTDGEFLELFKLFQGLREEKSSEEKWEGLVNRTLKNQELIQSYLDSLSRKDGVRLELPTIYHLAKELQIGLKIFAEANGVLNLDPNKGLRLSPGYGKITLYILRKENDYSVLRVDTISLKKTYVNIFKPRDPLGTVDPKSINFDPVSVFSQ